MRVILDYLYRHSVDMGGTYSLGVTNVQRINHLV